MSFPRKKSREGLRSRDYWLDFPHVESADNYVSMRPGQVALIIQRALAQGWSPQKTGLLFFSRCRPLMKTYRLDCSKISSEGDFWTLYLETIRPDGAEFFGRNLSAFRDAISGGGPGWPGECRITVVHTENLPAQFLHGLQGIAQEVREYSDASIVFA